jgi:8-oxo-dGTP diphosphatase
MEKEFHLASVAVIINEENQILLAQRNHPDAPNYHEVWNFPGGGVEFGEHPKDTAKREVREEVGLEIEILREHPYVSSWTSSDNSNHVILLAYPAKQIGGTIDFSADPETKDAKWFTYEDINFDNCLPLTKEMIDEAVAFLKTKTTVLQSE